MSRSTTTSGAAAQAGKTNQATATPAKAATPGSNVPCEKVAKLAYEKWIQSGCPHGCDMQHWLEAEAELKAELSRTGARK